jgi:histone-binding protein RBBP4
MLNSPEKSNSIVQKMVLGTHTSNSEPNHLMIMKVRLPNSENFTSDVKDTHINLNNPAFANYNKIENKLEVETLINHQGEVNKARVMPQKDKFHIIATITPSGEIHIFDYFKHPPKPKDNVPRPNMKLLAHTKEGYGLNWSTRKEGYLLSGADDHKVCVWDINSNSSSSPVRVIEEHKGVVEDVNWSKHHDSFFATCGDDKKLILWDLKQEKPVTITEAHTQEINSVEFNPINEFLILTASNDKTIALWDIRNLSVKLHNFDHHRSDVIAARWNPNIETLFASFSSDRRVNVWDLGKIGAQQSVADLEDGPSELLVI